MADDELMRRCARVVAGVVAAVAAALAAGCGAAEPDGGWVEVARTSVEEPVALAVDGDDLVIGERLTGRVLRAPIDDLDSLAEVATVAVATDGQRGLLGLVTTTSGTLIGSWTRPDGVLVIGDVMRPDDPIWVGPTSTDQATGGRIQELDDGTIVVGVGDLLDPAAVSDPETPNGKFLAIDSDGTTTVLSDGWNNPFGFAVTSGDDIVVADNAPGNGAERLARVSAGGTVDVLARGEEQTAPSGVALIDDRTVAVCRWLPRTLGIIDLDRPTDEQVIADDCALAVVALPDGGLAYSTEDAVVILRR